MAKRKPSPRLDRTRENPPVHGGRIWLYGLHTIAAALSNPARRCHRILLTDEAADALSAALARSNAMERPRTETVSRGDLDKILSDSAVHQGAAILVDPLPTPNLGEILARSEPGTIVMLLDQPSDPRNVGAILRSAAAFGVACVIVPDRHAPEATPVLAKAASGALDRIPFVRAGNFAQLMDEMKASGFWFVGLAADAELPLSEVDAFDRTALVIGAEGKGLRRLTAEKCDILAKIPISGDIGSLNMSAAAAIALYEIRRT
jgi:23S rRNA (guanosine2251-2'-O)-methyltransferase